MMTGIQKRMRRSAVAVCTAGIALGGVVVPAAHAQTLDPGKCYNLAIDPVTVIPCSAAFEVEYSVQGEGGLPGLVLPGKEYAVNKTGPVAVIPTNVPADLAVTSYEILDNRTRLDFIDKDGSTSKDQRVGTDGDVQGDARTSNLSNGLSYVGEVYVPREARNEVGTHGVRIKVTYVDGSSEDTLVPIESIDSGAAMHDMSLFDTTNEGVAGDKIENGSDPNDRSVVTKINTMVGQQRTLYVRTEQTRDPQCGPLNEKVVPVLAKINTVCDDKPDPPERLFITDEYGQVFDADGNSTDAASGVDWASLESFRQDGQSGYRVRLYPGAAQLNGDAMKTNVLYVTAQYGDGSWRTNRLEVTVRPHEDFSNNPTVRLPDAKVHAWDTETVELRGTMPSGHGKWTFGDSEQNPSWMTINPYSGKVTYAPQRASVPIGTYKVIVQAKAESGATMNIPSTVEVLPQKKLDGVEMQTTTERSPYGTATNSDFERNEKKGFFGRFWSALTSLFT